MDDTIIKLQTKVEHQAQEILTLSEELYAQQKELAQLKQQMTTLKKRFMALEESGGKNMGDEPPPPHY